MSTLSVRVLGVGFATIHMFDDTPRIPARLRLMLRRTLSGIGFDAFKACSDVPRIPTFAKGWLAIEHTAAIGCVVVNFDDGDTYVKVLLPPAARAGRNGSPDRWWLKGEQEDHHEKVNENNDLPAVPETRFGNVANIQASDALMNVFGYKRVPFCDLCDDCGCLVCDAIPF